MSVKQSIKDMDQWILAVKHRKQPTLQMRPTDGALLVLDAKNSKKIVHEIPMKRGYDVISLLQRSKHLEEANTALQLIYATKMDRIQVATEEFQRIEKELLSKITDHSMTHDPIARLELARKVGQLQHEMELASEALQNAITPIRTKYDNDDTICSIQSFPYTFEERSIPIVKKTA
jgi:CRISPR/Cas system CSM-associated protein Csm2 small subunit